jgi:acetolactate synthase-1/2/3 large subunit
MKIKTSDFIAKFLKKQNINHVWAVQGGASIHMIHSCHKEGIEVICPHNEQAGAFAADAYSRVTGNLGCAIATSGPGFTNLLTGIAACYQDSIPCLFLTGNVVRNRQKGDTGVRNYGFQELDAVSMVRTITKYAAQVKKASDVRVELEKAVYIAKSGRPGPVLLDWPDDLQREELESDNLPMYSYGNTYTQNNIMPVCSQEQINDCYKLLRASKRPILIMGWGVRLSKSPFSRQFIETLGIPICPTWGFMDGLPTDHPLKVGGIGINGSRAGNFAVQNSDFILAVGTKLSTRETGDLKTFAREAKLVVVDVDQAELNKFSHFGKKLHMAIRSDAKIFMVDLMNKIKNVKPYSCPQDWKEKISEWKTKYDPKPIIQSHEPIDPYYFVGRLSYYMKEQDILVSDTGCGLPWLMQGFKFKEKQRFYHDFNLTSMGWSVPAAIGAYFAAKKPIVTVTGDGSFLMNLQELATIQHHKLPIKIFILNNSGYSMVKQTCDEWFGGKYIALGNESLTFPDYYWLSQAFKFQYREIDKNHQVDDAIRLTINNTKPSLCNVTIPDTAKVWPKLVYGNPIEDQEPILPRDEFLANMIVEPVPGWDK